MDIRKIENKAVVEIGTCEQVVEVESNAVQTKPIKIKVEKKQACDTVLVGKNAKFKVVIENQCDTELHDLLFKDRLAKCLDFVEGSFKVDGHERRPEIRDNAISYKIDKLEPCKELTIEFEAKVGDDCCDCRHEPERSLPPTVNQVRDNDNHVRGTGVPHATVYIEFPGGQTVFAVVNNGGQWNISAPSRLYEGQTIYVKQVEQGKAASVVVVHTVIR